MPSRTLTILIGIVATILLGWVVHSAAGILQPLVIAALLCSMLQPIVNWLARRHIPPPVTVLVLVTLLLLGFARTGVWVRSEIEQFVSSTRPAPARAAAVERSLGDQTLDDWLQLQEHGFDDGGQGLGPLADDPDADPAGPLAETELEPPAESDSEPDEPWTADSGAASSDRDAADPTLGVDEEPGTGAATEPFADDRLALEPESAIERTEPSEVGWSGIRSFLVERLRASNLPKQMTDYLVGLLSSFDAAGLVTNVLGTTLGFSRGLLLVVLYMLFIFAEQAIFRSKILAVAEESAPEAAETLDSIARGIQRYLSVKTVISLATGILCYAVLEGLRIPYAPLFGFLTFLLNFIPTFGSIAAGVLATITTFASKGSWESVAIVATTYMAANMFLGSYIEPRILGRELNLSPLVILVSVVVWAGLWGVAGTFLAVPLTATIQIVLANNDATRPIAILLSSGPPREERKKHRQARNAKKAVSSKAS